MYLQEISSIKGRMNEFGRKHKPFLFVIDFEMSKGYFIENPFSQSDVLFSIGNYTNQMEFAPLDLEILFEVYPISREAYKQKFDIVYQGLSKGNSFLTNLTIKTPILTNLSLMDIFMNSTSPFRVCVPDKFVCFSPERFVKIKEKKISTYPMKGTIDADYPNAEKIILKDFKETAEHSTIVDLLRNDLSIVAENVKVERFRYIDHIQTNTGSILQVSSEITGELPIDYHNHLGDIIFSLLPAGSISGAPKKSTLQIIKEAEGEPRGFYTGIFGYYDGEELDSGVMIRFIEEENGKMYFRSGGGITVYSDWEKEYQEVIEKIYLPFI